MALATEHVRDPFACGDCGYFYFAVDTDTCITECPRCGPTAKQRAKVRAMQHRIEELNRQLQAGIYE